MNVQDLDFLLTAETIERPPTPHGDQVDRDTLILTWSMEEDGDLVIKLNRRIGDSFRPQINIWVNNHGYHVNNDLSEEEAKDWARKWSILEREKTTRRSVWLDEKREHDLRLVDAALNIAMRDAE